MSAETLVSDYINQLLEVAQDKADEASGYASSAQTAAQSIIDFSIAYPVEPDYPNLPFAPTEDPTGLFQNAYDAAFAEYTNLYGSQLADFLSTHYPAVDAGLLVVETWLTNVITNGGTGLPQAVEDAIWERARSRELKEAARLSAQAYTSTAARGFQLPNGVLQGILLQVQQDAQDKISTVSRDAAIKTMEIEVETVKFAVQQAVNYRQQAIASAIDYIKGYLGLPDQATDHANKLAQLKLNLWQSTAAFYDATTRKAALEIEYQKILVDRSATEASLVVQSSGQSNASRVSAANAATQSIGGIAQAAMSSLNTLVNISNQTMNQG